MRLSIECTMTMTGAHGAPFSGSIEPLSLPRSGTHRREAPEVPQLKTRCINLLQRPKPSPLRLFNLLTAPVHTFDVSWRANQQLPVRNRSKRVVLIELLRCTREAVGEVLPKPCHRPQPVIGHRFWLRGNPQCGAPGLGKTHTRTARMMHTRCLDIHAQPAVWASARRW